MLRCFTLLACLAPLSAIQYKLLPTGEGLNQLNGQLKEIDLIRQHEKVGLPPPTKHEIAKAEISKPTQIEIDKIINTEYKADKAFDLDFQKQFSVDKKYLAAQKIVSQLENQNLGKVTTQEANSDVHVKAALPVLPPSVLQPAPPAVIKIDHLSVKLEHAVEKINQEQLKLQAALKTDASGPQINATPIVVAKVPVGVTKSAIAATNVATDSKLVHVNVPESRWQKYLAGLTNVTPSFTNEYTHALFFISLPGIILTCISMLWALSYLTCCCCKCPCVHCCRSKKKGFSVNNVLVPLYLGVVFASILAAVAAMGFMVDTKLDSSIDKGHVSNAWIEPPISAGSFSELNFLEVSNSMADDGCNDAAGVVCHQESLKCAFATANAYTCPCLSIEMPCLIKAGCFGNSKFSASGLACATLNCGSDICDGLHPEVAVQLTAAPPSVVAAKPAATTLPAAIANLKTNFAPVSIKTPEPVVKSAVANELAPAAPAATPKEVEKVMREDDLWSSLNNLLKAASTTLNTFSTSVEAITDDKKASAVVSKIGDGVKLSKTEEHKIEQVLLDVKKLAAVSSSNMQAQLTSAANHLNLVEKDTLQARVTALNQLSTEFKTISERPQAPAQKEAAVVEVELTHAQKELNNFRITMKQWHTAIQTGEMYRQVATMILWMIVLFVFPVVVTAAFKRSPCTFQLAVIMVFFAMTTSWLAFTVYMDVAVTNADVCKEFDTMEAEPAKYMPKEQAALVTACLSRAPVTTALGINSRLEPVKVEWPNILDSQPSATSMQLKDLNMLITQAAVSSSARTAALSASKDLSDLEKQLKSFMINQNEIIESVKPEAMAAEALSKGDCSDVNLAYRELKGVVCHDILQSLGRMALLFGVAGLLLIILAIVIPLAMTRHALVEKDSAFTADVEPFDA